MDLYILSTSGFRDSRIAYKRNPVLCFRVLTYYLM